MNVLETKINVGLLEEIAKSQKQNLFRYYISIYLLNDGKQFVDKSEYSKFIIQHFNVKPKTVSDNLRAMKNKGWINLTADRIYFRSQEHLITLMSARPTHRAIYCRIEDISTMMKARAWIFNAILAGRQRNDQLTLARQTLKDKACGHSRSTQLKYEKIQQIEKVHNFGLLGYMNQDPKGLHDQYGYHIFVGKFDNKSVWIKQLPNTYKPNLIIGKRKRRKQVSNFAGVSSVCVQKYHHLKDFAGEGEFRQTRLFNESGVLWMKS